MSELNIFGLREYSRKDMFECTTDEIREADRFYIMHEADNVIVEKDKQIEELKNQRDGAFGLTKLARKQIDYQKYKRCLRNAEGCLYMVWYYGYVHDRNASNRMWKWRQRWLELAKKYKPNNEVNNG